MNLKRDLRARKLSHFMDDETWMNAVTAVELGFADGILYRDSDKEDENSRMMIRRTVKPETEPEQDEKKTNKKKAEPQTGKKPKKLSEPMLFSRQRSDLDLIQKINKHFKPKKTRKNRKTRSQCSTDGTA